MPGIPVEGEPPPLFRVVYMDGDEEQLSLAEILTCPRGLQDRDRSGFMLDCGICGYPGDLEGDPLVRCNGALCGVAVHTLCYGIATPEDKVDEEGAGGVVGDHACDEGNTGATSLANWLCSPCKMGLQPEHRRCVLCPLQGGAMKRLDSPGVATSATSSSPFSAFFSSYSSSGSSSSSSSLKDTAMSAADAAPRKRGRVDGKRGGSEQGGPASGGKKKGSRRSRSRGKGVDNDTSYNEDDDYVYEEDADEDSDDGVDASSTALAIARANGPNNGPAGDTRWAHVWCAMWHPETGVGESPLCPMEPIMGVKEIDPRRYNIPCIVCSVPIGPCIRCSQPGCRNGFHPLCARRAAFEMSIGIDEGGSETKETTDEMEEEGAGGDVAKRVQFQAYCRYHTKQREMNGKAAREAESSSKGRKHSKGSKSSKHSKNSKSSTSSSLVPVAEGAEDGGPKMWYPRVVRIGVILGRSHDTFTRKVSWLKRGAVDGDLRNEDGELPADATLAAYLQTLCGYEGYSDGLEGGGGKGGGGGKAVGGGNGGGKGKGKGRGGGKVIAEHAQTHCRIITPEDIGLDALNECHTLFVLYDLVDAFAEGGRVLYESRRALLRNTSARLYVHERWDERWVERWDERWGVAL